MKIGILTLPLYNNYGGILQAAALYRVLEECGHEPIILSKKFDRKLVQRIAGTVLRAIPLQNIANIRNVENRRKLHYPFYRKFMPNMTRQIYTNMEMEKAVKNNQLNCVIVGSDQVWRSDYVNDKDSDIYFLDFGGSYKKVSYAASFGKGKWTKQDRVERVGQQISKFDSISVRELSGKKICEHIFGVNECEVVLDPTLLVHESFYAEMQVASYKKNNKYILNYVLDDNPDFKRITQAVKSKLSSSLNVKEILLDDGKNPVTVQDWVNEFRNSEFVITDSFHGTVFAIIFKKNFIAIGNVDRGLDRFTSLLGQLGLLDRLVTGDFNHIEILNDTIDYSEVHRKLEKLKKKSLKYLEDSLK